MILVSVIVPVFNSEEYLHQSLSSIANQSISDIEVICVDDGSSDNSLCIVKEYVSRDCRFKLLRQKNKGAGGARNLGLSVAKGKYVYFMDSDDYCDIDLLEKAIRKSEEFDSDITVFDFFRFNNQTGEEKHYNGLNSRYIQNLEVFSHLDVPEYICSLVNPTPWNKLYKRQFLLDNGLQYMELPTTNDITFATLSVILANRITYIPIALYHYRVNISSNITSKKRTGLNNVIKAVLEVDNKARKLSYYDSIKNSIRSFIANNLFVALDRYAGEEGNAYYVNYSKEIDSIFYSYHLFLGEDYSNFMNASLYKRILYHKCRARERKDIKYLPKVIVSMTSYPDRIHVVHKAIASIYLQSFTPDKILLWLCENQFPNKLDDLPKELIEYTTFGLEIRWCKEDLRPHKKYLYTIKEYPLDVVVTFDDDLIYHPLTLEKLVFSYIKYPESVSTVRAHLISFNDNNIAPYSDWLKEYNGVVGKPSMRLFSTSGAGTLYPPNSMDPLVLDADVIKSSSLNADDIWLKAMQVLAGTPVVLVDVNRKLEYIPNTQNNTLMNTNVLKNENDLQLANVISICSVRKNIDSNWFLRKIQEDRCPNTLVREQVKEKSFKRAFLFIPNKIYGGYKCYQEHGLHYTLKRIKEKIIDLM